MKMLSKTGRKLYHTHLFGLKTQRFLKGNEWILQRTESDQDEEIMTKF